MMQHLFVYGSLGPGRQNEHILAPLGGSWQPATVRGILRQTGWGAAMGFPGLVLDNAGDKIDGLLFSSDRLADFWSTLDEFEGEQYERVLTQARLADGALVTAYVYALNSN